MKMLPGRSPSTTCRCCSLSVQLPGAVGSLIHFVQEQIPGKLQHLQKYAQGNISLDKITSGDLEAGKEGHISCWAQTFFLGIIQLLYPLPLPPGATF